MIIRKFTIEKRISQYKKISLFDDEEISGIKIFEFAHNNKIYSSKNGTGKTTLVRAILYSLGYTIPNTEMVKFENYEFNLIIEIDGKTKKIMRYRNVFRIDTNEFSIPDEATLAHQNIFNTASFDLLKNMLAVFYMDQEKGWTLLNRGIIIGENRLNIESFFRGLNDSDCYELVEQRKNLTLEINKYKIMKNISKYQQELKTSINKEINYKTIEEEDFARKTNYEFKIIEINKEIKKISQIIKENNRFMEYIEKMNLRVKYKNDEILVSKDNLMDFDDITAINQIRYNQLLNEKNEIVKELTRIEQREKKQAKIVDIQTVIENLDIKIRELPIQNILIDNIIKELKKEKSRLEELILEHSKRGNEWVNKFYIIVEKYANELFIPFNFTKNIIFTNKLKGYSGAILHKLVFIFKLAYIKLMSEKLKIKLTIIIDSPNGREIERNTIEDMFGILERDFSEHQIIISSIYKYDNFFKNSKIFTLEGNIFD